MKPATLLSQAILKYVAKILSSRSMCKGSVLYPAKNEEIYDIAPYQKFSCHVTLATFKKKKKLQHVGHNYQ